MKERNTREQRISNFFTNLLPELMGQPLLVGETIWKVGRTIREGEVVGFNGKELIVHLLDGKCELQGGGMIEREEKDVCLEPPAFFEAYDRYIHWVIVGSSFSEREKRRITREYSQINVGYQKAYAGSGSPVRHRDHAAWEMPQTIHIGKKHVFF